MSSSAGSKGRTVDGRALVAALQAAMRALPTSQEKAELRRNVDELIKFLTDLRDSLDLIPAVEDASQAGKGIEALAALLARAESNVALASALGIDLAGAGDATSKRRPRKRSPADGQPPVPVGSVLEKLRQQPVDSIRRELEDPDRHSSATLKAIAGELGIRGTAKLSRETMAHQISMKIANYRGYQRLRGDAASPSGESEDR